MGTRPTHYDHNRAVLHGAPMAADELPEIPTDDHDDLFPTDVVLGVTAWQLHDGQTWLEDAAAATPALDNEAISYDGEWATADDRLWPSRRNTLTVIGYAPYGAADRVTREEGVVFTADTRTEMADLMYTPLLVERTKFTDGGRITLPYRHALAEVEFRVRKAVEEGEQIAIRRISLDGVAVEGVFSSLPEPEWRPTEARADMEFFAGNEECGYIAGPIGKRLKMIPQGLRTGVSVEYDFRNLAGATTTVTTTTEPLYLRIDAGRCITLTLSVNAQSAQVVEREICNRRLTNKE